MDYSILEIKKDERRLLNIGELHATLEPVNDKRQAKGKRYTIGILLIVVILAKLSGEDTPYGIAEWAKMRAEKLQKLFGYHRRVSLSNKTIQRLAETSLEDKNLLVLIKFVALE